MLGHRHNLPLLIMLTQGEVCHGRSESSDPRPGLYKPFVSGSSLITSREYQKTVPYLRRFCSLLFRGFFDGTSTSHASQASTPARLDPQALAGPPTLSPLGWTAQTMRMCPLEAWPERTQNPAWLGESPTLPGGDPAWLGGTPAQPGQVGVACVGRHSAIDCHAAVSRRHARGAHISAEACLLAWEKGASPCLTRSCVRWWMTLVALICLEQQCLGVFRGFFVALSWPSFWANFTRTRPGKVF